MNKKLRTTMFYIGLFAFIVLACFQSNCADYDIFARLLQGQAFWDLGNILHHDIFSYTPTHTWFDHEWGASVVFYKIFKLFGPVGLLWLKSLMVFGIFFFTIQALKIRGVKFSTPYNFLFYFFAYHAASQSGFENVIRCQLFTYLFFSVWLYLLERIRKNQEYYLLVTFIPMMLFWSNIHGGCAAGFGLLVLYSLGEALNKKPFKQYLFTLFGCALVTFANPWGFGYVKFLVMATTMPRILIQEWQPTFAAVNTHSFLAFKVFFIITLLLVLIRLFMKLKSIKNIDFTKAIVLITMTFLSLKYTRHQPFFVLSVIVFLYDDFYNLLGILTSKIIPSLKLQQNLTVIKEILIFIIVAFATIGFFATNKPQIVINNISYPIKAIEFIRKNNLNGNLLVDFQHGSYAAYKLYPSNLIAMDGRYEEVYYDYMLPLFNNFFMQVGENPNMLIETFRPDIIVVAKKFEAEKYLAKDKSYIKAFSDENFSVFVDKKLRKNNYELPTNDIMYYNKTLFDSDLKFSKVKPTKRNKTM